MKLFLRNLKLSSGNLPKELGANRSKFEDSAGKRLALHQGWRVSELVLLEVSAGDSHGHGGLARGHDHAHPRVSATAHRATACVHHEADQEPVKPRDDTS
jgi:hypothetical protein